MTKDTRSGQARVRRQGRRVMPAIRRHRGRAAAGQPVLTLGDLVAAAYDAAGPETRRVARILSSVALARAIDRRIVIE